MDVGELAVRTQRQHGGGGGGASAWHWDCFVCAECRQLLVDFVYFHSESTTPPAAAAAAAAAADGGGGGCDAVYCGRHHAETLRPRCRTCDEVRTTGIDSALHPSRDR